MERIKYKSMADLQAGLEAIRQSPADNGVLELIVRRPQENLRETITEGELDLRTGLVGDNWKARGSSSTPDRSANPEEQLTLMNSRLITLIAGAKERWPLAGDQLYVDLDLSRDNLPPGTQLSIGTAIIEATSIPHTGCSKFLERFGPDAQAFIHSPTGRHLQLRGINAKVVKPGTIHVSDRIQKIT